MVTTQPLEIHKDLTYPNIGPRDSLSVISRRIGIFGEKLPYHQACTFLDDFGQNT